MRKAVNKMPFSTLHLQEIHPPKESDRKQGEDEIRRKWKTPDITDGYPPVDGRRAEIQSAAAEHHTCQTGLAPHFSLFFLLPFFLDQIFLNRSSMNFFTLPIRTLISGTFETSCITRCMILAL